MAQATTAKPKQETVRGFCTVCPKHCPMLQTYEGDNFISMVPDEQSAADGWALDECHMRRGRIITKDLSTNPNRLRYPLKRVGARGEGRWERISWEQAIDEIAAKMLLLKQAYGAQSVAFGLGEPKALEFAVAQRLATAFGTPNVATPGYN